MRKRNTFVGRMDGIPSNTNPPASRRVSLEEKILRLVRQYRAAEKRRQKRQTAPSKRFSMVSHSRVAHQMPGCGRTTAKALEKAARACSTNTPAWKASAAMVPAAPGFVAGRLFTRNGRPSAITVASRPPFMLKTTRICGEGSLCGFREHITG